MEHRSTITPSHIAGSDDKTTFIDRLDFYDVVGHIVASIISDGNNGYSIEIDGVAVGTSGGSLNSIVAGTGIAVDNTDPANPVVSVPKVEHISDDGTLFEIEIDGEIGIEAGGRVYGAGFSFANAGASEVGSPNQATSLGDAQDGGNLTKVKIDDANKTLEFRVASADGQIAFFDAVLTSRPVIPAVASPQDIVDALKLIGLVVQDH